MEKVSPWKPKVCFAGRKGPVGEMRIAIIHSFYRSSSPSGENAVVLEQARLLEQNGHQVKIFGVSSDNLTNLEKIRLPWNVAFFKGSSLEKQVVAYEPELLHVHNLFPNIGYFWLTKIGVPVVATFHNFRPFCANGLLSRNSSPCTNCISFGSSQAVIHGCYRNSALKSIPLSIASRRSGAHNPLFKIAVKVIVLSEHSKSVYQEAMDEPSKIEVIPNFTEQLKPSLDLVSRDYWLYVGRLSSEKGISELLASWPAGKKLLVYGTGVLEFELRELYSTNPDIIFKGFLDAHQKADVFNKCIALVFPSTCFETSPLVMAEAFSIGRPILAYSKNVVGMKILESGGGVVFEDFNGLSLSMTALEQNANKLSTQAYRNYSESMNPKSWLSKINTLYTQALD
jgi:glycosyltransferase involved in cell wall biosynthesis